jgi:hypothetical protein
MGLRNQFGWDRGRGGFSIDLPTEDGGEPQKMQIEFVSPTRRYLEDELVDVPPAPSPKPNFDLKALPPPREEPFRWPGSHKPGNWMK